MLTQSISNYGEFAVKSIGMVCGWPLKFILRPSWKDIIPQDTQIELVHLTIIKITKLGLDETLNGNLVIRFSVKVPHALKGYLEYKMHDISSDGII